MRKPASLLLAAVCLSFMLSGCLDGDRSAPAPAPVAATPQPATAEENATFTRDWVAWDNACAPQPVGRTGGALADQVQGRVHPPEDAVSMHLELSWVPVNPTATQFNLTLADGEEALAFAEGPSPIVIDAGDGTPGNLGEGLGLDVQPSYCPANVGSALDQTFEVHVVYTLPPAP